jgi:hypothetical protein
MRALWLCVLLLTSCAVGEGSTVLINREAAGVHVEQPIEQAASAPAKEPKK